MLKKMNLRKHAIPILICILLIIILFNMFWRSRLFEANDPNVQPPYTEQVEVYMKDTTKSTDVIDPEAVGKFYVYTGEDYKTKHLFQMDKDASNVTLRFKSNEITKLYISPITIEPTDKKHKANIFPPSFTLTLKFPSTKNYKLEYQDISANQPRNMLVSDQSGLKYMSITSGNSIVSTPVYLDETPQSSIGSVDVSVKNKFTLNVNSSGNKVSAFGFSIKPS